jgi:hypothetical protein
MQPRGHFIGDVRTVQFGNYWRLERKLVYVCGRGGITVPSGFFTDFASVPRVLWPLFPPTDPAYSKAAILHDRLYEHHPVSRRDADKLLYEAARAEGCSLWRAWCLWLGVRLGGSSSYATGGMRQAQRLTEWLAQERRDRGAQ